MTDRTHHDERLAMWLDEIAPRRGPEHLLENVVAQTSHIRPRPTWLALLKEQPMQVQSRVAAGSPALRWALMLAALLIVALLAFGAFAAAAQLITPRPKTPPPFGVANNGLIAFARDGAIVVADPDGTHARVVVDATLHPSDPTWAPDGTRFAFLSRETAEQAPSLMVANADGSNAVNVSGDRKVFAVADHASLRVSWSPNGRQLVFTSFDGIDNLFIANADGSGVNSIPSNSATPDLGRVAPAWSPDGDWIAFSALGANSSQAIYVVHPDGSGQQRLGTSDLPPSGVAAVAWAPDPSLRRVLYTVGADGSGDIAYFDIDTNAEMIVSNDPANEFFATWSPDGKRIAWIRGDWNDTMDVDTIDVVDFDALGRPTGRRSVLSAPMSDGFCSDHPELAGRWICGNPPVWSPDGSRIFGFDGHGAITVALVDEPRSILEIPVGEGSGGSISWQRRAP